MSLAAPPPMHDLRDVAAIEAAGIDAFLPERSPFLLLRRAARLVPDKVALRFLASGSDRAGRDVTYAALDSLMVRTANLFHALGLRPGQGAVAMLMPNVPETHAVAWGGCAAGAIAPINHYLEPSLIGRMIEAIGAHILVIHGPAQDFPGWEKLAAIRAAAPGLRHVLRVGEGPDIDGVSCFEAALAGLPADRLEPAPVRDTQVAALFHTGGTTGAPKFVPQTHFRQALGAIGGAFAMGMGPADRVVCGMPLFHCGGLFACGLIPLAQGATVVQAGANGYRDPSIIPALWSIAARERLTVLVGPPTVYAALRGQPIDGHDLSSVRHAISSASGLPVAVLERFEAHAGIRINEGYGVTEAVLLITCNPPDGERRKGTVGLRLPFAELAVMRVAGRATPHVPCAPGEIGAVLTRGPMVFDGYPGLPPEKAPILPGGWLDTGDLGRLDADGYLAITGRSKDIIIRGGHNIDPELIEGPLSAHPAVELCAAVGRPDAHAGEVPVVYVVPRDGMAADAAELLDFARARIEERAAIPKEVFLIERLPLTAVGKVSKLDLRLDATRRAVESVLAGMAGIAGVAARGHPVSGTEVVLRVTSEEAARAARKLLEPFTFGVSVERAGEQTTIEARPQTGSIA